MVLKIILFLRKEDTMFSYTAIAMMKKKEAECLREEERLSLMTLEEKKEEFAGVVPDFPFYAMGLVAPMFFLLLILAGRVLGYNSLLVAIITAVWAVIIAGAPFVGLHWGVFANRIKKYGVYSRTSEHTAFDVLFGVIVAFAIEICFSYMNSIGVNLILFAIGIGVEIILLRWCLFGKSPIK